MKNMNIAAYIDHSILKPDTLTEDIITVCSEAVTNKFAVVCVPPLFVRKAKELTAETNIKVSTVIGFPFGYSIVEAKVAEMVMAVIDGADDIEMVMNTSAVKNNDWQFLAGEINTVLPVIRSKGKKLTVVMETGLLTEKEIITACDVYGLAGIDAVKLGTGFFANEKVFEDTRLIRRHLASAIRIKTGVEIKDRDFANNLIEAGANRLCCSNGLMLLQESLDASDSFRIDGTIFVDL